MNPLNSPDRGDDKLVLPPYNAPAFKVTVSVDGGYGYFVRKRDYEKLADDRDKLIGALKAYAERTHGRELPQDLAAKELLKELGA